VNPDSFAWAVSAVRRGHFLIHPSKHWVRHGYGSHPQTRERSQLSPSGLRCSATVGRRLFGGQERSEASFAARGLMQPVGLNCIMTACQLCRQRLKTASSGYAPIYAVFCILQLCRQLSVGLPPPLPSLGVTLVSPVRVNLSCRHDFLWHLISK